MAVGLYPPENIKPVDGIRLAACSASIYKSRRDDLVLIELSPDTQTAAVFTRNQFSAAPVIIAKSNILQSTPAYCLINAGNANAGTGEQGINNCQQCCQSLADEFACNSDQILPFSTGVIGEPLPVNKIISSLPNLKESLSQENWLDSAKAIMTTDTIPKLISRQLTIAGKTITITGMAKGSGMIRPDMATMLAFIATDAGFEKPLLQSLMIELVNESFNRITVDGDTSTNDACVLFATGKSGHHFSHLDDEDGHIFREALSEVFIKLAQSIVRDGEGASKFITVDVEKAATEEECLNVAYDIAHSPLVKTALFASDPNWGRILAVIGRSNISNLDINAIEIYLDNVCIVQAGGRASDYTEEMGQKVMAKEEITVRVVLNRGSSKSKIWTTDLSYDYVKINAEYRT